MCINRLKLVKLLYGVIICFMLTTLVGIPRPVSAIIDRFASPGGTPADDCTYSDPCDLQTAVNESIGGTVYVEGGELHYYGTGDQVLFIDHSVAIYGGWDGVSAPPIIPDPVNNPTILDGYDNDKLIHRRVVTAVLEPAEVVILSGFTIQNGNATGNVINCYYSVAAGCGGGIMVSGGSMTIEDNIIEHNIAATTSDTANETGYGGGIWVQNHVNVTISNNSIGFNDASTATNGPENGIGGSGGGIFVKGVPSAVGMTITGNEIHHNNAASATYSGIGDGLFIYGGFDTISQNYYHDNNSNLREQGSSIRFHTRGSLRFRCFRQPYFRQPRP